MAWGRPMAAYGSRMRAGRVAPVRGEEVEPGVGTDVARADVAVIGGLGSAHAVADDVELQHARGGPPLAHVAAEGRGRGDDRGHGPKDGLDEGHAERARERVVRHVRHDLVVEDDAEEHVDVA